MVTEKISAWDPAEYLDTPEKIALYLEEALAENDPSLVQAVLGDIARSKGMSDISRETGLARESLYRSLSEDGNPNFGTIMKVMTALGLRLQAVPITTHQA
jgi:probable addiction module antidote protein